MAAVLAAASYSRGGLSLCLASSARRVMVPGGSTFHLEPGAIETYALIYLSPTQIMPAPSYDAFLNLYLNQFLFARTFIGHK